MKTLPERVAETIGASSTPEEKSLDEVAALYTPDMHFIDPVQDIRGRDAFIRMLGNLRERCAYLRFVDVTVVGDESHFIVSFTMKMRFKVGPEFTAFGTSEFRGRDGLVVYHRDSWDVLGTFLNGTPGLGPLYRRMMHLMLA